MDNEKELSFEELYEQSLKETKLEKIVTGKVISITSKGEIYVDINYKADGIIPKSEYSDDENKDPKDEFKPGDEITAEVLKKNDGLGNVLLSYKRLKTKVARENFAKRVKQNEIFEAAVEQVNDKGLITIVDGTRVFIPLSLSGLPRGESADNCKGKNIRFKITEYNPQDNKIIGSVRSVLDEEKKAKQDEFWTNCEVGKEYKGIVASISSYGAFIDLGPVQGLLHVSELTWMRNANVNDILSQGQEIKVKVLDLDKEHRRVKLTYCEKGENPWNNVKDKYHIGDIIKVKVVKMMPFGVFAEIEPGVEGLVHISQISERKITKPDEELKQNEHVNAKIIDMDLENQKIELSIKELEGTSNEYREEM